MHCSIKRLSHVLRVNEKAHTSHSLAMRNQKSKEQIKNKNKQINKISRQIKRNASHFVWFYK